MWSGPYSLMGQFQVGFTISQVPVAMEDAMTVVAIANRNNCHRIFHGHGTCDIAFYAISQIKLEIGPFDKNKQNSDSNTKNSNKGSKKKHRNLYWFGTS